MALSKAQAQIVGAVKDSKNPFFKSSYADLASVWGAIRTPLTDNELAVVQTVEQCAGEQYLVTQLIHSSGQWISGRIKLIALKKDMQSIGGAITYARRYGLAAIMGVPQIDDDGNLATKGMIEPPRRRAMREQDLIQLVKRVTKDFKDNDAVKQLSLLWGTDSIRKAVDEIVRSGMIEEKAKQIIEHFGA